jgi:hypothetical protein
VLAAATLHDRANEAEDALNEAIAVMQDVKERYFKTPPLLIEENLGEPVPPNPQPKASCVEPLTPSKRDEAQLRGCD